MSGLVSLLKVITPAEEGHSRPRAAAVMLTRFYNLYPQTPYQLEMSYPYWMWGWGVTP